VINDIKIGEAVSSGLINNQTLAYFLCRTYLFLTAVGIRPEGIRFRQHRSKEMAHYASDCWDAEIETSYGWVECVGHAMRDAFDLTKHSEKTKVELVAARPLEKPITVKSIKITIEKPKMGKAFKKDAKYVTSVIEGWNEADK
jgi:glycyl-tRNA synthetase